MVREYHDNQVTTIVLTISPSQKTIELPENREKLEYNKNESLKLGVKPTRLRQLSPAKNENQLKTKLKNLT